MCWGGAWREKLFKKGTLVHIQGTFLVYISMQFIFLSNTHTHLKLAVVIDCDDCIIDVISFNH